MNTKYHRNYCYNPDVEWLKKAEEDLLGIDIQQNITVLRFDVNQLCNISTWTSPGLDRIQGFWLKKIHYLKI